MKPSNSAIVLTELIRHYSIPVTKTSIVKELEKHPHQGNLFAMSDVLNSWKIPNEAFRIEFEVLQKIPLPCVAHLKTARGEFAIIHQVSHEHIFISKGKSGKKKLTVDAFKKAFTGTVLVVQKDQEAGEANYGEKRKKEILKELHYPALALGTVLVGLTALVNHGIFIQALRWQMVLLAFLKTVGLITSILLLIHSMDAGNPLIGRLCSGKKKDCNAILSSRAAKITAFLSWSEMGFFYFGGSWLFLLFNNNMAHALTALAIINLLCLPYTFYSIYYQMRLARQWCVFCVTIMAIFWLEFFAFPAWYSSGLPGVSSVFDLLIAFMLPVLTWYFIKPFLKENQKIHPLEKQLKKFKNSRKLFQKALLEQNRLDLPHESNTIILGNRDAENIVTIVSNLFCQPCSEAHKIFSQWLSEKDSFKLQIIFTTVNNDNEDKTRIVGHLYQLFVENKENAYRAIHDLYEGKFKNFKEFIKTFPVKKPTPFFEALLQQKEWIERAGIKATPAVFLNGYRIPTPWRYQDIKYFL